jgi:hypothetical protein
MQGAKEIQAAFSKLARGVVTPAMLMEAAKIIHTGILERTAKGVDADGKAFPPYSEKYAARREARGRPTSKVDLFFTGQMLGAVTERVVSGNEAHVFFADTQQAAKAHGHTTGWRGKKPSKERRFFAVGDQDVKKIHEWLKTLAIPKKLRRAGLGGR